MMLLRLIKMCSNKISSRVHRGKHLSDNFLIQNGLKQGDASSSPFLNFALEYAIRKVKGKAGATEITWGTSATGLC
jgi:hypothetical protein